MPAKRRRTESGARRATDRRRKPRPHPTPKWLVEQRGLDEMAQRRCLMVLSVLSGETPVTEAIASAKISRGTYYELETRALNGMLRALTPGVSPEETASAGATRRVQELEQRVVRLEQEKRRVERLLFVTRKLMKRGPIKAAPGRPSRGRQHPSSTRSGPPPSTASKAPAASSTAPSKPSSTTTTSDRHSTPTKAGGAEP